MNRPAPPAPAVAPPRLADRWIAARLHPDERDEILGDLNEQFRDRAARHGARAASRWYWRQAWLLVWGFSVHRRDVVSRSHDRTRGRWALDNAAVDVRYAWRSLRHAPAFALVALFTLVSGVGLSTAMFSFVNGILLDPLPYAHADRLIRIADVPPETKGRAPSPGGTAMGDVSIGAWLATDTAVSHIAPYDDNELTVTLPDGAANLVVVDVSRDFFTVLSMPPVAGRTIGSTDLDAGAPPVAVISERLARRSFGGPAAALGQPVTLELATATVVGVLSDRFAFPNKDADIWRPGTQYRRFPAPGERRNMAMRTSVIAALAPGASIRDAEASGRTVGERLRAALQAAGDDGADLTTFQVRPLLDDLVAPVRPALLVLGAGTVAVLLAACVNLANLLLTRATARQREAAMRVALGASRWRVGRPVLVEVTLIAGAGAAGGALVAWWLLRSVPLLAPDTFPRIENIHFDWRTLGFAVAVSFVTALVAGWLPTLQMPASNVQELSGSPNRVRLGRFTASADRLRSLLVAGQIALAVSLLVIALLIARSFSTLLRVDLGYRPDGVLTLQSAQPFANARQEGRLRGYYTEMLARIRRNPSVVAAGYGAALPMHQIMIRGSVNIVGREAESAERRFDESTMAVNQPVSDGYLDAIGTPVIRGRGFEESDTPFSEKVVLIDETLDRMYFPHGEAIGQQIRYGRDVWRIVGVTAAVKMGSLDKANVPVLYFPTAQMNEFIAFARPGGGIAIRTTGDPRALVDFVREIAREVDASVPLYNVATLNEGIHADVAQPRFFTVVLALFSLLAVSTAVLGIYGVLAYSVERRRVEFGIRRALGATERHVVNMVMTRAVLLAVAGLIAGVTAAAAASGLLRSMLFGISPADPWAYGGSAIAVAVVVLAASWQPVRRALRIDPARALRVD